MFTFCIKKIVVASPFKYIVIGDTDITLAKEVSEEERKINPKFILIQRFYTETVRLQDLITCILLYGR